MYMSSSSKNSKHKIVYRPIYLYSPIYAYYYICISYRPILGLLMREDLRVVDGSGQVGKKNKKIEKKTKKYEGTTIAIMLSLQKNKYTIRNNNNNIDGNKKVVIKLGIWIAVKHGIKRMKRRVVLSSLSGDADLNRELIRQRKKTSKGIIYVGLYKTFL